MSKGSAMSLSAIVRSRMAGGSSMRRARPQRPRVLHPRARPTAMLEPEVAVGWARHWVSERRRVNQRQSCILDSNSAGRELMGNGLRFKVTKELGR